MAPDAAFILMHNYSYGDSVASGIIPLTPLLPHPPGISDPARTFSETPRRYKQV